MADTVEKIIFDDSQAQPVIKGLTESIQTSDKAMKQFNNTLSNETTKAANQAAVSEAKLNESATKGELQLIVPYQLSGLQGENGFLNNKKFIYY